MTHTTTIYFGDTGSGDFLKTTEDSLAHSAVLMGNRSCHGDSCFVIYEQDIDNLIAALKAMKEVHFEDH